MTTVQVRITTQQAPPPPPPPSKVLGRILHDYERNPRPQRDFGDLSIIPQPFRAGPPQTIPVKNYPKLVDLMCSLNPIYTRERAEQWLGPGLLYTNQTWGVFHAPVICGGAVLEILREGFKIAQFLIDGFRLAKAVIQRQHSFMSARASLVELASNNIFYFRSILISDPVPTVQESLDSHLSAFATSVHRDGRPGITTRPDGRYKGSRSPFRMIIPRKTQEDLYFAKGDLQILPPGIDPANDPLWTPA